MTFLDLTIISVVAAKKLNFEGVKMGFRLMRALEFNIKERKIV